MRNFLNTTFKCLSRSIAVAFVVLFAFQVAQAAPIITQFKTSKTTAIPEGNWELSWSATGVAGCYLKASDCSGSVCGSGFYNPNSKVVLDDSGLGTYTYTLTCYSEIKEQTLLRTKYTVNSPIQTINRPTLEPNLIGAGEETISSPITVKVVDAENSDCADAPNPEMCTQMCTAYGNTSASCSTCKLDAEKCEVFAAQCLTDNGKKPENQSPEDQKSCTTENVNAAEKGAGIDTTIPECGFDPRTWGTCAVDWSLSLIKRTILPLAASFLQLCAYLFEFSVQVSIVQFSNLISGVGDGEWLTNIWSTIRDILNIGVIFVLLYAAINIIVGRGGEIKKLIAGVILFGVMTNFSLFLTKAAVDITNVIALEFYNQMRVLPLSEVGWSGGLGATIVSITGLTNLYDPDPLTGSAEFKSTTNALQDSFLYLFAMTFIFIAVGFVFLQAAGMFVLRTISVILLLIFSPLMFAGTLFSPLQKWIEQWHKEFIGQITVAPLFMILLYVVLTILRSLVEAVNTALKDDGDMFSFLSLILITSFLTLFGFGAVLSQSKRFAGTIGGKGAEWGNKLGGFALGGAMRGTSSVTARLGQNTLGRLGQAADSGTGRIAKTAQFFGINNLKNRTYDARNVPGIQKAGGGISKILSTATGAPISADAGSGLKTLEEREAADAEAKKKKLSGIQAMADKKIEDRFKEIDGGVTKYEITDKTIIDTSGNEITRTDKDTDQIWERKVKTANATSKKIASDKKAAYLTTLKTDSRARTKKGKAAFRAKKAAEEKLDKTRKAEKDHDERKKKLKAFKEDLKIMFASDASAPPGPPLGAVRVSKTQAEIEAMTNQEVSDLWESIIGDAKIELTKFKANAGAALNNPADPGFTTTQKHKNNFEALIKRSENAKKTMDSLKKAIDDHDKK